MSRFLSVLITSTFISASGAAFAMDAMKDNTGAMMDMSAMDANGDGMVSKQEFLKYHERMWSKMKKNNKGMVDMKDMQMMHDGTDRMATDRMKGDGMMKDNMKGDAMMKDNMKGDAMMKDNTKSDSMMKEKGGK